MSKRNCPSCGAPVALDAKDCRYCGEPLTVQQQTQAAPPPPPPQSQAQTQLSFDQFDPIFNKHFPEQPQQQAQYQAPPPMHHGQPYGQPYGQPVYRKPKNKVVAGLLGIFLGGLGIHKFYLGRIGWGILYLIFCWTYIPMFLGFIEGIVYLASNEERFHMKYSR